MINNTLKQAIIDSGISHRQLSMLTGVDRRVIGRFIEGGRGHDIRISNAAALADYLGLELKPKPAQGRGKGKTS